MLIIKRFLFALISLITGILFLDGSSHYLIDLIFIYLGSIIIIFTLEKFVSSIKNLKNKTFLAFVQFFLFSLIMIIGLSVIIFSKTITNTIGLLVVYFFAFLDNYFFLISGLALIIISIIVIIRTLVKFKDKQDDQFLIIKLFIKNHEDINDSNVRNKHGKLASIFGIMTNIFICTLKLFFGIFFNLISLIADGLNNLADASSSIISLVGFKLNSKPADKEHPFGHARMEYIAGFVVSILIVVLGLQLLINSVKDIIYNFNQPFHQMDPAEFTITVIVLSIAIIMKLYQGYFYNKVGKKISSLTLIAASVDSRNDVIATSVVLFGLLISRIFGFYIDGYLGSLVGLFIMYSGFNLIKETSDPLISEKIDDELIKNYTQKILSYEGVLGIHDLQIHAYGPGTYFASIHVEVDASKDILTTHDLIDNIEKDLHQEFKILTTIHMDPVVLNDPYTEEVKAKIIPEIKKLNSILNIHDFRVVKGPTHTNIIFDVIVNQGTKEPDSVINQQIQTIIKDIDQTYNAVITIDHDYSTYIEN